MKKFLKHSNFHSPTSVIAFKEQFVDFNFCEKIIFVIILVNHVAEDSQ